MPKKPISMRFAVAISGASTKLINKSNKEDFVANQSEIEAVYNVAYLSLKHLINKTIVLDQEVKTLAIFEGGISMSWSDLVGQTQITDPRI